MLRHLFHKRVDQDAEGYTLLGRCLDICWRPGVDALLEKCWTDSSGGPKNEQGVEKMLGEWLSLPCVAPVLDRHSFDKDSVGNSWSLGWAPPRLD